VHSRAQSATMHSRGQPAKPGATQHICAINPEQPARQNTSRHYHFRGGGVMTCPPLLPLFLAQGSVLDVKRCESACPTGFQLLQLLTLQHRTSFIQSSIPKHRSLCRCRLSGTGWCASVAEPDSIRQVRQVLNIIQELALLLQGVESVPQQFSAGSVHSGAGGRGGLHLALPLLLAPVVEGLAQCAHHAGV
jgi:hypothetical protein